MNLNLVDSFKLLCLESKNLEDFKIEMIKNLPGENALNEHLKVHLLDILLDLTSTEEGLDFIIYL